MANSDLEVRIYSAFCQWELGAATVTAGGPTAARKYFSGVARKSYWPLSLDT